jgi:hypothetical protein
MTKEEIEVQQSFEKDMVATLDDAPKKMNRHVVIALKHMKTRRNQLTYKIDALTKERDDLDESIAALE